MIFLTQIKEKIMKTTNKKVSWEKVIIEAFFLIIICVFNINTQSVSDTRPQYSIFTLIGQINTRTRDGNHTLVVDMLIEYDLNDIEAQKEFTVRVNQLRDFTRNYFSSKNYTDLLPGNEDRLKQEIMEILNNRYLDTAKVRGIIFNKLEIMEL